MKHTLLIALVLACAGGCAVTEQPRALACMESYKMDEFVIGAWAFSRTPFDRDVHRLYAEAGFNTIIHCIINQPKEVQPPKERYFDAALDAAAAEGVGVILHTARAHGPWGAWDGVAFPEDLYGKGRGGYAVLPGLKWLHGKYGKHPATIGYLLSDDAGVRTQAGRCATWMKRGAPSLVPYVSNVVDASAQSKTDVRILSRQNYPWVTMPKDAVESARSAAYCGKLNEDRLVANVSGMAAWPIFLLDDSPSRTRFKAFAPIAYGAQGIMWFAYSAQDPKWHPGGSTYTQAARINGYLRDVVGPRVVGCRSVTVYGDMAGASDSPAAGKLIEEMSDSLICGVLAKERTETPRLLMLVDTRTVAPGKVEPPRRTVTVRLAATVQGIIVLGGQSSDASVSPRFEDNRVIVQLDAGQGLLLELGR